MRISNEQIAAALDEDPHICTEESCPVGSYYVSAVDGPNWWRMAGPYNTHAESLADVDRARRITDEKDRSGRAWFMSWGTVKVTNGTELGNLNKAGLIPTVARILILTLFMLGALATGAHAASVAPNLPDAPKPHIDRIQWSLFAAHAGFRTLDVYSTHQAISRGYREIVLPRAIGEHTGPMIAYSAGTVATDYFAARYLIQHHHPMMAKILTSVDIAQDAPWAVHNLMLKKVGLR